MTKQPPGPLTDATRGVLCGLLAVTIFSASAHALGSHRASSRELPAIAAAAIGAAFVVISVASFVSLRRRLRNGERFRLARARSPRK